ncbi:hypothetical protein U1701_12015 [Sphingomonas sp. PB2P19]|uniref:hypothetical protein n=1 Tax=Sphingomonas rhamnosi TaxID=3096156 RepID=UPI002FC83540
MKGLLIAGAMLANATIAAAQTAPAPAPAPAAPATKAAPNVLDRAVNTPGTNWSIYGAGQTSKLGTTQGVPGNQAMRVTVAAKGANAWDVGAQSPIQKAIGAGDAILVAVYLRAPQLKDGETTSIPFLGANEKAAPYAMVIGSPVIITNSWKLYYASGKTTRAFAADTANVAVHLAAAKHVVELGPVFVLDFGPDYDPAKLPRN